MAAQRILLIIGHPDPSAARLARGLAAAYAEGAKAAGHDVQELDLAAVDIPYLRSKQDYEHGTLPAALEGPWKAVLAADHLVFFFPLWLGTVPALLKAFLEQILRPGLAFRYPEKLGFPIKLLKGRSARLVVTMGMPAPIYRFFYLAHGISGLRRNILNFVGIAPVRTTYLGMVEGATEPKRERWFAAMRKLGAAAR